MKRFYLALRKGLPFPYGIGSLRCGLFATGAALVIASTLFMLWKCQFGVDLTDESYYLLPAWKFIPLGDRPLIDELGSAPRHSDLLNYLFVRPFVPYSFLAIRRTAIAFYAIALLVYLVTCFRSSFGVIAGLLFSVCLLLDIHYMPTWSYNWWCRDFLLFHHSLFFLSMRLRGEKAKVACLLGAGVCMGIIVVAYNPAVLVLGIAVAAVAIWMRKMALPYALGAALVIAGDLSYLLRPGIRSEWLQSFRVMSSLGDYANNASSQKLWQLLLFILHQKSFWILLAIGFGLIVPALAVHSKKGKALLSKAWPCLFAVCLYFLVRRVTIYLSQEMMTGAFIALGIVSALLLTLRAAVARERVTFVLVLVSVALMFCMGISSVNGYWALSWAVPSLALPAFGFFLNEASAWKGRVNKGRYRMVQCLFVLFLVFIGRQAWLLQKNRASTYYDLPIADCTTRMEVAPLAGIYTSPRRAFLIQNLHDLMQGKKFALVFGNLPGALLFSDVRSAVDTSMLGVEPPPIALQHSLVHMKKHASYPELVIRAVKYPWTWGFTEYPPTPPSVKIPYEKAIWDNPYSAFSDCVRSKDLVVFDEFEAFQVDPERVSTCLNSLFVPMTS